MAIIVKKIYALVTPQDSYLTKMHCNNNMLCLAYGLAQRVLHVRSGCLFLAAGGATHGAKESGGSCMERKPILVALAVALACVLARGANDPACADPSREGDPYAVCRHHELTVSEFNRCISAVYLDEMRKTDLVIDLEQALSGPGPDARASSQQCLQQNPCMYDPATGRHQECLSLAADEHCHHYGGPCSP